jgi:hypothetical protein
MLTKHALHHASSALSAQIKSGKGTVAVSISAAELYHTPWL